MRKDKEFAIKLRRSGKSYRQIRDELKVPVSTLSDWFSKIDWSKAMAEKLAAEVQKQHTARIIELNKIRGRHLDRVYEEARQEARMELEKLKYSPLFIAGVMLYWGEGDKTTRASLRLSNTDPELVKTYVFFLKNVCRIPEEKIHCSILVYPDLDKDECVKYWSQCSGIPVRRFVKPVVIIGRHKTKRLGYGVCIVYVQSTYLKVKMLEWLRLLPQELMSKTYYENM